MQDSEFERQSRTWPDHPLTAAARRQGAGRQPQQLPALRLAEARLNRHGLRPAAAGWTEPRRPRRADRPILAEGFLHPLAGAQSTSDSIALPIACCRSCPARSRHRRERSLRRYEDDDLGQLVTLCRRQASDLNARGQYRHHLTRRVSASVRRPAAPLAGWSDWAFRSLPARRRLLPLGRAPIWAGRPRSGAPRLQARHPHHPGAVFLPERHQVDGSERRASMRINVAYADATQSSSLPCRPNWQALPRVSRAQWPVNQVLRCQLQPSRLPDDGSTTFRSAVKHMLRNLPAALAGRGTEGKTEYPPGIHEPQWPQSKRVGSRFSQARMDSGTNESKLGATSVPLRNRPSGWIVPAGIDWAAPARI